MVLADTSHAAPEQLLHDADIAMHQAKAKGGAQTSVFSKAVRETALQRLKLESELRTALANNEVFLCYQPKVLLHSGQVTGFEALMRWPHAERGLIPPDEFIPLAEETDLILEIGRWTLRESMRQLSIWRAEGLVSPTTTVAVNLSARQFEDEQLIPALERKLQMFDLPAECLELEVTEGVLILDAQRALKVLQQLKTLGVKLDLDDFGTGYSSLSYLQRFPFDSLKVDKSFVRGLPGAEGAAAIAHSIVALGRALNMGVIAEGVETPEQASCLRGMGCQYGQGYLFAKPLRVSEVEEFMFSTRAGCVEHTHELKPEMLAGRNLVDSQSPSHQ